METSKGPYARRLHEHSSQNDSRTLTTRTVTEKVSAVLCQFPAKVIAKASGSSVRAAENIRQGDNAMSLVYFLRACQQIPELRSLAMELMGCETTINPDRERALAMLVNSYMRQT